MPEPAPRGADPQRIAVLEKLRPRARRGSADLRAGVAALKKAEVDVLHDVDIEKLIAAATEADASKETTAP